MYYVLTSTTYYEFICHFRYQKPLSHGNASIDPEPEPLPTWPEGPEGRVGHFRHSRRRGHLYLSFTSTSSYLNNYDVKRAFG